MKDDKIFLPLVSVIVRTKDRAKLLGEALTSLTQQIYSNIEVVVVDNLSIGQQQRVAVARALLGSPNLILADEPTSALDQDSTNNFLNEVMQTFNPESQAILMVSHDLSLAPHFDTVIDFNKANV